MKNTVLIFLGFCLFFVLGVALNSTNKQEPKVPSVNAPVFAPVATTSPNRLSDSLRDAYIDGCNEEGGNFSYCDCTMVYLEEHFTREEIIEMFVIYADTEILPDGAVDAAVACMNKYNDK
jgi:hypothetical protein